MKAVIGLGFGDEGKGLVTDYLNGSLVIRYSGGQQAGHNVVLEDGTSHIFSNFGSGTMKGVPTYWSKFCTVDPVGMMNELKILIEKGFKPVLYIDGDSPITTPYDKYHNSNNFDDLTHGTCGVGVGSTFNREENFHHLTFSDIFNSWVLDTKMESIKDFYNVITDYKINTIVGLPEQVEDFFVSCNEMLMYENFELVYGIPEGFDEDGYVFEGSQGLLLDQHFGFFPHVTRSNTGTKNILEIIKDNTDSYDVDLYLVTRAYQTRHGNGPMTNDGIDFDINNTTETNVDNKYQGEFRKSILDVSLLEYGMNKDEYIRNSSKNLVITCLDHIDEYVFTYDELTVLCKDEDEFIGRVSDLLNVENVYISKSNVSENIKKWK